MFHAAPEKEIEYQPDARKEDQGYHPCERADRIAVLGEHHINRTDDNDEVDGEENDDQPIIEIFKHRRRGISIVSGSRLRG